MKDSRFDVVRACEQIALEEMRRNGRLYNVWDVGLGRFRWLTWITALGALGGLAIGFSSVLNRTPGGEPVTPAPVTVRPANTLVLPRPIPTPDRNWEHPRVVGFETPAPRK